MKFRVYFLLFTIIFMLSFKLKGQNSQDQTSFWVLVSNDSAMPTENNRCDNENLNGLLDAYNVDYYQQVMPFANTPMLRNVYEIKTNNSAIGDRNQTK